MDSAQGMDESLGWAGGQCATLTCCGTSQQAMWACVQGAQGAERCLRGQREGAQGRARLLPSGISNLHSEHCRGMLVGLAQLVGGSREGAVGVGESETNPALSQSPVSARDSLGREALRSLSPSRATPCFSPGHPQHSLSPAAPSWGLCQLGYSLSLEQSSWSRGSRSLFSEPGASPWQPCFLKAGAC